MYKILLIILFGFLFVSESFAVQRGDGTEVLENVEITGTNVAGTNAAAEFKEVKAPTITLGEESRTSWPAGAGTMTDIGFGASNYTVQVQVHAGSNVVFRHDGTTNVYIDATNAGGDGTTYSADGITMELNGTTFSVADWIPRNLLTLRYELWNHIASYSQGLIDGPSYWFDDTNGIITGLSSGWTWKNPGYRNRSDDQAVSWTQLVGHPSAPDQRPGGAVLDGNFYIMGGYTGGSLTNVWQFDGTDTWTQVIGMPVARYDFRPAVLNQYIYCGRGEDAATNLCRFDGSSWADLTAAPISPQYLTLCSFNYKLYSLGGGVTNVYSYDGTNWTEVEGIPVANSMVGAIEYSGKMYVAGGSGPVTNMYSFDGTNWSWDTALPTARNNPSLVVYGSYMYCIAGDGAADTNVYYFDGATWTETDGLPTASTHPASGVIGGNIYTFSGNATATTNMQKMTPIVAGFVANMTFVATNITLSFTPSYGYVSVLVNVGTNSVDTNNIKLYMSRNYGTNYSEATLTISDTWATSNKLFTGTVALTNQPTGSNTLIKITCDSNKVVTVIGVAGPCN